MRMKIGFIFSKPQFEIIGYKVFGRDRNRYIESLISYVSEKIGYKNLNQ